jgi:quercetin dioxygenase-like cupin family protein
MRSSKSVEMVTVSTWLNWARMQLGQWRSVARRMPSTELLRNGDTMSEYPAQQASQPQAIKRTILQRSDVPGTNYETIFGIAEIAPNADFASHTHPGTESGYLMEGSLTHLIEGQPARVAKAGDSVLILAGVPHSGRAGPAGAKIISAWVVEKGKVLASLAEPLAAANT